MEMNLDQFTELCAGRYSCRAYDRSRVPGRQLLTDILGAARLAPSACNRQPWKFTVVTSARGLDVIAAAYDRPWIRTAPAVIICWGDHAAAWHRAADGKNHTDVDVAIAAEHICLAARAAGLETCWICNFDTATVSGAYPACEGLEPVALLTVGYAQPGTPAPQKTRKAIDETVEFDD